MKRLLLSAGLVLAVSVTPRIASAQVAVVDAPRGVQAAIQHAETLLRWANQLREMQRQYEQLRMSYEAIAHGNLTYGIAGLMHNPALRSTLPPTSEIGGLVQGAGSLGQAAGIMLQNRYYTPDGTDFAAMELRRVSQALANIQAISRQNMMAVDERRRGILELMTEIDNQPDIQASAALQSRIEAEKLALQNHQSAQADLIAMQTAQARVDELRLQEKGREDAENLKRSTEWAWGAFR